MNAKEITVPRAMLVESVTSAMNVFPIPMFPLKTPRRLLLTTSIQNVFDNPKDRVAAAVPNIPHTSGGLLPIRSESLPQPTTVKASEA